jgi:hypothetical protein
MENALHAAHAECGGCPLTCGGELSPRAHAEAD